MATTEIIGIHQSDIVLREAIKVALQELRDNSDLIYDALGMVPQDKSTEDKYGDSTVEKCKKWFLNTETPVRFSMGLDNLKFPVILLALDETSEAETTLADVHCEPSEKHPYNSRIKRPIESVEAQESYSIQLLVQGEPENLLFLHAMVLFGLLRRKADMLDARGFHRMKWTTTGVGPVDLGTRENLFGRTIRLSGYVRHAWPKYLTLGSPQGLIASVPFSPRAAGPDDDAVTPTEPVVGGNLFKTAPADWMDRDILSGVK